MTLGQQLDHSAPGVLLVTGRRDTDSLLPPVTRLPSHPFNQRLRHSRAAVPNGERYKLCALTLLSLALDEPIRSVRFMPLTGIHTPTRSIPKQLPLGDCAMDRIPSAQPACLERAASLSGMDFSHMYPVFKHRKGLKRCEESKDTYKLPHRLIEKKRRDRINECIAQLKDLLPEHLKLTTLGHLEKAVVLELTLKHVQSLSSLIEQQQQQILTLQSGSPSEESRISAEEMFHSGFQLCAEETLCFLQGGERKELVAHLHRVASKLGKSSPSFPKLPEKPVPKVQATNCVPVIRRAAPLPSGEQSGTDTDTDSGYGGEAEKGECHPEITEKEEAPALERIIKQEKDGIPKKKPRIEATEEETRFCSSDLSSLGVYPTQPPLCLPFYFIPPSANAYLPMLEKYWYPNGSVPMMYPPISHSGLLSQDTCKPQHATPQTVSPLDSSALLQALKQMPALGTEPKD
ncbi:class E basic helix-loop-helix protein 40 isoform X2 [Xenopus laevis]|uniref:BHLH domain-containing protein n=3 Tax=Xenopus laevis TaxID=8355 RepID=A0A974D5B6_XENLA|nr:class E basic helix-loop-helix protein 40 isoform X2 [Xenopus laevis]OCT85739.1 hypothetical protein XELAEV_18023910mg [Xenopus laevis]